MNGITYKITQDGTKTHDLRHTAAIQQLGQPELRLGAQAGRVMLSRDLQGGFSLIELMTAITIMGILIALGMPSLNTYLQTAKLGTMARSFYTGVQLARSEAIRLNQRVDFVQTNDPVNSPACSACRGVERHRGELGQFAMSTRAVRRRLVEAKSALEGGGSGMTATGSNASITFNGLGAPANSCSAQFESTPRPASVRAVGGGGGPLLVLAGERVGRWAGSSLQSVDHGIRR